MKQSLKLTNIEFYALGIEIDVFCANPKVDLLVVHKLRGIKKTFADILKNFTESRNELIEKYHTPIKKKAGEKAPVSDGAPKQIKEFLDDENTKPNPKYKEFEKELKPISEASEQIEVVFLDEKVLEKYPIGDFQTIWKTAFKNTGVYGFNNIFKLFEDKQPQGELE